MASESKRTVHYPLVANGLILAAKATGSVLTGSPPSLPRAAHSLADTVNQAFLCVSLSLERREADQEHEFGHGSERFFRALVVAARVRLREELRTEQVQALADRPRGAARNVVPDVAHAFIVPTAGDHASEA